MRRVSEAGLVMLGVLLSGAGAWGQAAPDSARPEAEAAVRTYYLTNVSQQNDANEIVTALRNLLDPRDKVYFVPSQNAIVLQGSPEQLKLAQRLLSDLDRPKKTYRLIYTLTETDAGKRVGVQHFAMIVVTGQRTDLKQGSKVPVVTGSYNSENSSTQQVVTYLDIGMNFQATLDEFVNGVRLRTKVEQSGVAEERSGIGPQDPIVRQTTLEGTSFLTPGKPLVLGSLDIPGSTRHQDVEVVMEQVVP